MKEFLLLLLAMPVALLVVLNNGLAQRQPLGQQPVVATPVRVTLIRDALVATPQPTPLGTPIPSRSPFSAQIEQVIATALTWQGVPYLWGGCSRRGVDCSCFVLNAYASVGVNLPRTTVVQIASYPAVPANQAIRGDLVFFDNTCTNCGGNPTHVGLYLGNGQMIDAGDPVHIEPVYSGHNARFSRVLH